MKRSEILATANEYVSRDRAATHGDAERNFGRIAAYWSAHLDVPVGADDVAVMMVLLKCARIKSNPAHMDNWIDGCGYLACGGEIAAQRRTADDADKALTAALASGRRCDEGGPYGENNGPVSGRTKAQDCQVKQCKTHILAEQHFARDRDPWVAA
ncbi:DUF6378 domain-containing protein [Pontibaca salina]|uniref:DUF6378 domain-containing protein n=1 Tax=Pontibaca salina TaxID=2795731 RepID=A0A934HQI9_9RHOB|nr:DUF6378 domain-containing protein [Pontibaca salina]MBI6628343.1 hypothetical protein [Pontibaca salina]